MTVYEPRENELALRTDAELVALSEAALEYTIAELDGLELGDAPKTRAKVQALEKLLAAHLRSKEAKLEAANNLTEARLRIERHTGALIPRMQKAGLLLSQGYSHVERHDMLAQPLTDYAITRDQSATWQKVARSSFSRRASRVSWRSLSRSIVAPHCLLIHVRSGAGRSRALTSAADTTMRRLSLNCTT